MLQDKVMSKQYKKADNDKHARISFINGLITQSDHQTNKEMWNIGFALL